MKSYIDRRKVSQRAWLSHAAAISGLLILLLSVLLPLFRPALARQATFIMAAGLAIAMLGIYSANRWVKRPRPEERLHYALKSLSDSYQLFHYPSLPCDHVLLTPSDVVILETVNLEGSFAYRKSRWRERMSLSRALRYIVEEHLGNPIKSALGAEAHLHQLFAHNLPDGEAVPVRSMVVFVHPGADLDVENPEIPVVKVEKLKRLVAGKGEKAARLPDELYQATQWFLVNKTVSRL